MTPEIEIAFWDFKEVWHSRNPRGRVPSMLECFEGGAAHEREECARELEAGRIFASPAQTPEASAIAEAFTEAAKHIRARGK